MDIHFSF
jgi:ATP synthase subunit 6